MHTGRPLMLPFLLVMALAGGGLTRSAAAGVRVWNSNVLDAHTDITGFDDARPLGPIRIVGSRNGTFSGKVVVGTGGALRGVSARMTQLRQKGGSGVIGPGSIRVRYAKKRGASSWHRTSKAIYRYDILEEKPPAEVPPLTPGRRPSDRDAWIKMGRAILPIWVTVQIPDSTPPGDYEGTLTISGGGGSTRVPVKLEVSPYRIPDPAQWRTWAELIQSPDSVAIEYKLPLWSKRHFELMDKSMEFLAATGTRTCYIPLICETNFGNAESMVRWKKKGSSYSYDFGTVERYLDMFERHIGKPQIVCFAVWDVFLEGGRFGGDLKYESKAVQAERMAYKGKGPEVTLAGGAKQMLPQYSDPAARAAWAPLAKQIRGLMQKRGLAGAMALGMGTDSTPPEGTVKFWEALLPGVPWVVHSHGGAGRRFAKRAKVCYQLGVWGFRFVNPASTEKNQGWKRPELLAQFSRDFRSNFPIHSFRYAGEMNIGGGTRGIGRFGGDFWSSVRDKRGRRAGRVYERYPKANWRNLNINCTMTDPGPDGAIGTARFEMFREGLQECEARIQIASALTSGGAAGAGHWQVLKDRDASILKGFAITSGDYRENFKWYCSPGNAGETGIMFHSKYDWQGASAKLFGAAYEIAKRTDPASQKARTRPKLAKRSPATPSRPKPPAASRPTRRAPVKRTLEQKLASWLRMAKSAEANRAYPLARSYLQRVLKAAPEGSPARVQAEEMMKELDEE